jgi:hypothetical protein
MKLNDLTGKRFGRLVVLHQAESRKIQTFLPEGGSYINSKTMWRCRCDCGREKDIEAQALRTGNTRSCGCLRREASRARNLARRQKCG